MANFKRKRNQKKRRMTQVKYQKLYRISGGRNRHTVSRTQKNRRKACATRSTRSRVVDEC